MVFEESEKAKFEEFQRKLLNVSQRWNFENRAFHDSLEGKFVQKQLSTATLAQAEAEETLKEHHNATKSIQRHSFEDNSFQNILDEESPLFLCPMKSLKALNALQRKSW